jgi:hypothetical protein
MYDNFKEVSKSLMYFAFNDVLLRKSKFSIKSCIQMIHTIIELESNMMNCYYYLAINIKGNHFHTLLKWQRPKVSQRKKENQLKVIEKSSSHVKYCVAFDASPF